MNKQYYYTCCGMVSGKIVGETYFVSTRDEAYQRYKEKYGINPDFLDGPFYRKLEKVKKQIDRKSIKLTNKIIKGMYKGQLVKGIKLSEPENYILLMLNNNSTPKDSNIVHVSELKDLV